MHSDIESIQRQVTEIKENLLIIEEKKSEYVSQSDIPVQLIKDERRLQEKLGQLHQKLNIISRPVPEHLPYLADRSDQEFALGKALEELQHAHTQRPLVCVIHGDEQQSHEMFLERLSTKFIPNFLELDTKRTRVTVYHPEWPVRFADENEFVERMRHNLAKILGQRLKTVEDIHRFLAGHPGPVMIISHLVTENWLTHGPAIITNYLEFWQNWPELQPGQHLIVCWSLKYLVKQPLGFFKKRRYKRINHEIEELLSSLSKESKAEEIDFTSLDRLVCSVLPKLEGITRQEAEDWARSKDTRQFCRGAEVFSEIRQIYEQWELENSCNTIPMEELAVLLKKKILGQYILAEEVYS